jgi:hypothetical protein
MYEGGWWFLTGLVYVNEMGKPLIIFFFTARLPEIYGIWSFACLGFDWVMPREMLDLLFCWPRLSRRFNGAIRDPTLLFVVFVARKECLNF